MDDALFSSGRPAAIPSLMRSMRGTDVVMEGEQLNETIEQFGVAGWRRSFLLCTLALVVQL